jgi:hypothetical protein
MRLAAYLWAGRGQPPAEYVSVVLCRDVYHCTPVELRRVPLADILAHLTVLDWEGRVRKKNRQLAELGR